MAYNTNFEIILNILMQEQKNLIKTMYQTGYLWLFFSLSLGVLLPAIDTTMIATVMPQAIHDLGGLSYLHWSQMLYDLGSIIAGTASGLISLKYGIKKTLLTSAIILSIGCLISSLAPTMSLLMFGRLIQGFAAGGLLAIIMISIENLFPSHLLNGAIGLTSAIWGVGAFVGPFISGIIVEYVHWRWSFAAMAILSLIMILFWRHINFNNDKTSYDTFPFKRLIILCFSIFIIAYSSIIKDFAYSLCCALLGFLLLIWFFVRDYTIQQRENGTGFFAPECLLPKTVSGRLTIILFLMAISNISFAVYGPLLMALHFGTNAIVAGFLIALESIGWSCAAVIVATWSQQRGRDFIPIATMMIIIALFIMAYSFYANIFWLIIPSAFLTGAGFGASYSFLFVDICTHVREDKRRFAASGITALLLMGFAIGASLAALIINHLNFNHETLETFNNHYNWGSFFVYAGFIPFMIIAFLLSFKKVE